MWRAAHVPDRDLDLARVLARDLVSALDLDRDRASARDRVLARDLVSALDLDRAGALDRALAHDLASDLASDLAHALTRAGDLASASDLARGLASDLASTLASTRRSATSGISAVVTCSASSMPCRATRGLVALAVRLLPVAKRPRYREEFGVELVELSRCRKRWGYALRVLASAWDLRKALAETVRTSDGAPARRAER